MDNWSEWRKHQRADLLTRRKAITKSAHHDWSMAISASLKQGFPILKEKNIGVYWPFCGEYDPRPVANHFKQYGARLALPEVVNKQQPLCFREWWQEAPIKEGVYGIPVPDNTQCMTINAVIIPMVGFDRQGYRLGYGSGYFDRTLATRNPRPLTIGIAFEIQRLDSVHPQPHDIAMHFIVTEAGIYQNINNILTAISIQECAIKSSLK